MINNDRIVPIQKIDYLSMIGTVLTLASVSYTALQATTTEGAFSVTGTGSAGNFLANQPVQSLDFPEAVTGATVYFVAAFDFVGITIAGTATTPTGATIQPDGITLYKAVLSSGAVAITTVTPVLSA